MMHRWRLNASRNMGLSATLSARVLKLAGNCFRGFFHHHGTSPQRIDTSSLVPLAAGLTDLCRVRRCDVVVGLQIASGAVREYVLILDFVPQVALDESP